MESLADRNAEIEKIDDIVSPASKSGAPKVNTLGF